MPEKENANYSEEVTFAGYCGRWLNSNRPRLKESSSAKYLADLKNHILPFFGEKSLDQITSEEMERFIQILLYEKKLSPKTIRNILALFHSVFTYARKRSGQKLQEPEIIYPRKQRKDIRVLDEQEEKRLMNFLAGNMDLCKFGVYLALRTGLRIGEVCALRWQDISMRDCTISVQQTAQRIRYLEPESERKAGAKTRVMIDTPKTESSCRIIPLMPDLAALCLRFGSAVPGAFVLTGTRQCMEPRKLQRRLKNYTKECMLADVHFHTLRHTFATRCVEAGCDVKTLSEILGHSNITVTLNQYVHPNLDQKRENMSRLKTMIPFSSELFAADQTLTSR